MVAVLVALVLGLALAEVAARALLAGERGGPEGDAGVLLAAELDVDLPETTLRGVARRRVLHPFFGYGQDHAPSMGVGSRVPPLQPRGPGELRVGLTGGSVAGQVRDVLEDALREALRVRGHDREPVLVGLLVDGFKQPQQLAAVTWFLTLGAELDVVVNLDGFNDIVLPFTDNYRVGVFPFYPRSWKWLVARRPSQQVLEAVGEIVWLRGRQRELADRAASGPLRHSALFGLYARLRTRSLSGRIARLQEVLDGAESGPSLEANGPFREYASVDDLFRDAAGVWARSSILLRHVLAARGCAYVHVLQPNQYFPGTRVLTARERRIAHDPEHPYAGPAVRGYPHLLAASREIVESGVRFVDATRVFADVPEDVYRDDCCHLNPHGKRILAALLAEHALDAAGL